MFYGEARDLMELLGNLLDNACKYGAGEVHLEAYSIDAGLDAARPGLGIVVGNDGTAADLAGLVQRGRRGDERAEGHGLGLNIVSEVVNAYGGTLEFGRSPLGGTEVTITIPPEGGAPNN
jgi:two-component system sensor histidine kinase PhoQ